MKHRHSKLKMIVAVICAVVFFAAVVVGFAFVERYLDGDRTKPQDDDAFSYSDYNGKQVYFNGAYYAPKGNLDTLLILGIDTSAERPDATQSDFLMLLILDRTEQNFSVLEINRDTMADITKIDQYGQVFGSTYAQLALAHTYGADDRARCLNTLHVIETLLYDIDIQHYLSMTMDAIPILNDSVGGVTLQLLDDFSFLDPTFTKDAVVTLHGSDALSYVRARGQLEDSSNLSRMERQKQYINALMEKLDGAGPDVTVDMLMKLGDTISSDCTTDQLNKMAERLEAYTYNGFVSLKGEAVVNNGFMEYHLDEQAARETIINLFYDPIPE